MDFKLILALVGVALAGCSGKASPDSHVNAPEVDVKMTSTQSMERRGMSSEEIANEQGAQSASMNGATR